MIQVENLRKSFGDLKAVDGVSFEIAPGEIYGLLGPNGAGKTTTLSMMAGLLRPDGGRIRFDGVDLAERPLEVKGSLGVVPQENALYEELDAGEHLRLWGGLYGLAGGDLDAAVGRVLEQVGLGGRAKDPVKQYSGGMKRRLNLALGLVHSPRFVLLDEPTVGIDPQARLNILEVVRAVAADGAMVLYTTHYLEEAEKLCDRVAIIDHGKLLAEGSLEELQRMVGGEEVVAVRGDFDAEALGERLLAAGGVRVLAREAGRLVLATAETAAGRGSVKLLETLFAEGVAMEGVAIEPPSLNSLFLKLTGRELRD
jgi:ABC-2 type transport system ATP-binding protein